MRYRMIALVAALASMAGACDDPLDVNPRASILEKEAYDEPVELDIAVTGLYDGLQDADGAYGRNAVVYPDLYADALDFTGTYQTDREVDQHLVSAENVAIAEIWGDFYDTVNRANNVIAAAPDLEEQVGVDQVEEWLAQAYFARALSYFNLVRFFGGVPLMLEPTWSVVSDFQPSRATQAAIYQQIEDDLAEAIADLPPTGSAYTATVPAAQMLLAKAHLEQGAVADCALAMPLLNDVIGGGYSLLPNYDDVFAVEDNDELIFALEYTVNDNNSLAFWFFSDHPNFGGRWGFAPSADLLGAYEGAERADASVNQDPWGQVFGYKFRRIAAGDDDVPVLRLADAYLLRAEANLCQSAAAGLVLGDINAVRNRAGVPLLDPLVVDTDPELLDALAHERFVELAMEGHRFFDLRRLGLAQSVLGLDASQLLFPIPQRERDVNPNLEQNTGY